MEFKIHRLCRDNDTIRRLKKEEKEYNLPHTEYVTGIDLFTFINNIINNCTDDYALIVHDDVILPINISDNVKECIKSIKIFEKNLNHNVSLYLHKVTFKDSLKDIILNIKDEDSSFVLILENEGEILPEFAKYLQLMFSNSNLLIGDTVIYKESYKIEKTRVLSSSIDNCLSGTTKIPIHSAIYNLSILKSFIKEFDDENLYNSYFILMYSLMYETPKSYPLPFISIPNSVYHTIKDPSYEKTTIMSELINRDFLPESYYNFFMKKNKEKEEILNYYYPDFEEFNAFKKGLIWKTLEKYRKIKSKVINNKD